MASWATIVRNGSQKPTTLTPTAQKPTAQKPTTQKPTTLKPTTLKPTTQKPTTLKPTARKPSAQKQAREEIILQKVALVLDLEHHEPYNMIQFMGKLFLRQENDDQGVCGFFADEYIRTPIGPPYNLLDLMDGKRLGNTDALHIVVPGTQYIECKRECSDEHGHVCELMNVTPPAFQSFADMMGTFVRQLVDRSDSGRLTKNEADDAEDFLECYAHHLKVLFDAGYRLMWGRVCDETQIVTR